MEEHEPTPGVDRHGVEAELRLVELRLAAQVRRSEEAPVEIVRPLVIRAGDAAAGDATGKRCMGTRVWGGRVAAQPRTAVPADVVEGAQTSLAVTHQQDALPEHI